MSAEKIKQIVYVSRMVNPLDHEDLSVLLEQANVRNKEHFVTGFLTTDGINFFQLIEGPESSIKRLYENINNDRRHTNIIKLYDNLSEQRLLPNWHMHWEQFEGVDKNIFEILANFNQVTENKLTRDGLMVIIQNLRFPTK